MRPLGRGEEAEGGTEWRGPFSEDLGMFLVFAKDASVCPQPNSRRTWRKRDLITPGLSRTDMR